MFSGNDTNPHYTNLNFINWCKTKNWQELKSFISSDLFAIPYKLVASAVIDTYNHDKEMRYDYGLNAWNKDFSIENILEIKSLSENYLVNLHRAYKLAKRETGLADNLVAEKIKEFIYQRKSALSIIIDNKDKNYSSLTPELKKEILDDLGDFKITELDVEKALNVKNEHRMETQKRIALETEVQKSLEKILGLPASLFNFNIYVNTDESSIIFKDNSSKENINKFAYILKLALLNVKVGDLIIKDKDQPVEKNLKVIWCKNNPKQVMDTINLLDDKEIKQLHIKAQKQFELQEQAPQNLEKIFRLSAGSCEITSEGLEYSIKFNKEQKPETLEKYLMILRQAGIDAKIRNLTFVDFHTDKITRSTYIICRDDTENLFNTLSTLSKAVTPSFTRLLAHVNSPLVSRVQKDIDFSTTSQPNDSPEPCHP